MAIVIVAAKADRRVAEDLAGGLPGARVLTPPGPQPATADVVAILLTEASAADADFHAQLTGLKGRVDVIALVGADPSPFDLGSWRMLDLTAWLDDPSAPMPDDVAEALQPHLDDLGAMEVLEPPPPRSEEAARDAFAPGAAAPPLPSIPAPTARPPAAAAPAPLDRRARVMTGASPQRTSASPQQPKKRLATPACLDAHATAFAPKRLRRANAEIVQIIVHQPRESAAVALLAKQADPRAAAAGAPAALGELETGARIRVAFDVRGGGVSDNNHPQVWRGAPLSFPITVEASDERSIKQVVVTARILVDDAQIGLISFARPIANARAKPDPHQKVDAKMRRAERVFLSYSSKDRETVAIVAQAYASAGVPCFFDRTSLASGEEWSPRLLKEIERADLFHLFWSKNASASEWVAKEARHAMTRRRKSWSKQPDITVQMLDGPPWAPHPDDLDAINFDDFVRAAIVGYARGAG